MTPNNTPLQPEWREAVRKLAYIRPGSASEAERDLLPAIEAVEQTISQVREEAKAEERERVKTVLAKYSAISSIPTRDQFADGWNACRKEGGKVLGLLKEELLEALTPKDE